MTAETSILLAPDAGPGAGGGHVDRMLALAEELIGSTDVRVLLPGNDAVTRRATERGVPIDRAAMEGADGVLEATHRLRPKVVVLDGYRFDVPCQAELGSMARVVIVDDLSQPCAADLLVNPAPGGESYPPAPGALRVIAGPSYAIMSRAYVRARELRAASREGPHRILMVSGSADIGGILADLVSAPELFGVGVDVALGHGADELAARPGVTFHRSAPDLAGLLAASSMYVGAAGTSAVQAAAVGVPSVISAVVDNQVPQAQALSDFGAAMLVDRTAGGQGLAGAAASLLRDPARLQLMGSRAARMVDGLGAGRVADEVRGLVAAPTRR